MCLGALWPLGDVWPCTSHRASVISGFIITNRLNDAFLVRWL